MTIHGVPVGAGQWQSSTIEGDSARGLVAEPWEPLPQRTPGLAARLQDEQDQAAVSAQAADAARAAVRDRGVPMGAEEVAAIYEDLTGQERDELVGWLAGYDPRALRDFVACVHRGRS